MRFLRAIIRTTFLSQRSLRRSTRHLKPENSKFPLRSSMAPWKRSIDKSARGTKMPIGNASRRCTSERGDPVLGGAILNR